jgi:hypothetical protein
VADALVHLQRDLVAVEHDVGDAAGTRIGAHERGGLLGDARRLLDEAQSVDVFPTGLAARPDMRARVAAQLEDAVASGRAVHPRAALRQDLLDLRSLGGEQHLVLAPRAHHHLAHDHVLALQRRVRAQAEVDLVGEGDREGVVLHGALVAAAVRLDRGQ